jgi:hypothetical protein
MRSKFSLALVCVRVCPCVCVSSSVCWNLATITWQEKGVIILLMVLLMTFYRQMQAFPPGSVTRRRFYTPRNLLPEALQGESFWPHTSLYTQTLLHRSFYAEKLPIPVRTFTLVLRSNARFVQDKPNRNFTSVLDGPRTIRAGSVRRAPAEWRSRHGCVVRGRRGWVSYTMPCCLRVGVFT